jgi:class 3 adenylate cyclase
LDDDEIKPPAHFAPVVSSPVQAPRQRLRQTAVGEKIIECSGTLERYAGDGVLVVFNDPVPVENPALPSISFCFSPRSPQQPCLQNIHRLRAHRWSSAT